jgi:hypothetical protein
MSFQERAKLGTEILSKQRTFTLEEKRAQAARVKKQRRTKLYLDIDGVILTKKNTRQADDLEQFVDFIIENFNCYWLTTHCKGDSDSTIRYLTQFIHKPLLDKLKAVKPTNWDTLKTEAIDFSSYFLWLDDNPFQAEINYLKNNDMAEKLILVDLNNNSELIRLLSIMQQHEKQKEGAFLKAMIKIWHPDWTQEQIDADYQIKINK